MRIRMTSLGLPAALLAASLFGACSNTARGLKEDTAQNTEKAKEASADAAAATERATADAREKSEQAAEATKNAASNAADQVKDAAHDAANATSNAAHDVATATRNASAEAEQKSKSSAHNTAATLDGAQQTLEIKSALVADKSVDASGIDVDTDGKAKVVTLHGHVPNAAQKAAAGRIAKNKAPDYRIVNNLMVQ